MTSRDAFWAIGWHTITRPMDHVDPVQGTQRPPTLWRNLLWGLAWGAAYAIAASFAALLLVIRPGSHVLANSGTTLPIALGIYFATGVIGGLIVGLLRPVLHTLLGQMIAGVLVVFTMLCVAGWAMQLAPFNTLLPAATFGALLFGPISAIVLRVYNRLSGDD